MTQKWYEIKAAAKDETHAEIYIYGDIGESWYGETVTAADFVRDVSGLENVETMTVRVNSYGGSVTDGIAIYNAIRRHKATVTVAIDGIAASIASLIAMAGDQVEMAENAMIMIHAPWGGVLGNSAEMRDYADTLDKMAGAMASSYMAKSGMEYDAVMGMLTDGKDHWYGAQEALELGLIDNITGALAIAASANEKLSDHAFWVARAKASIPHPASPAPVEKPAAAAAQPSEKGQIMQEANTPAAVPAASATPDIAAQIRASNKAMIETGKAYAKFGGEDLAMQAVSEGWNEDQLNAALLKAASAGAPHAAYGQGARVQENAAADKKAGFKSLGEFSVHVRNAALGVGRIDQRLMAAATTYGNEGSGADGGFAVPPQFAEEIMSLAYEQEQSLLAMADNTPVTGNSMTFPKDETTPWGSSGVIAAWEGEASTKTQKKPAMGLAELRLKKLTVLVGATDELLADSMAMTSHITRKMSEAVAWKCNDAIINGTGSGQPLGILTAASLVSQAKETSQTADTINATNVAKMYGRCLKGPGARLVWLVNPDAYQQLIVMTLGDQPIWTAPVQGMQGAPDGLLLGRPIVMTDACDTVGDLGDIILANMAGYRAITKSGGEQFSQSMHLWFDQDVTAFKLVFRMDGQPALASAVTPPNSSVTRSHFVGLAART